MKNLEPKVERYKKERNQARDEVKQQKLDYSHLSKKYNELAESYKEQEKDLEDANNRIESYSSDSKKNKKVQ